MGISLDEFIAKYSGKYIGTKQCVAAVRKYVDEVLEVPQFPLVTHAYQIFDRRSANFQYIDNLPNNFPVKGDIIVFGKPYGRYIDNVGLVRYHGHAAVITEASVWTFKAFQQNNPIGAKCNTLKHSYTGVRGWLRKK